MYSLPITTYADYWRATKIWSSYLGGVAVIAAGTQYSTLASGGLSQTVKTVHQQIKSPPPSIQKSDREISLFNARQALMRAGTVSRGGNVLPMNNLKALTEDNEQTPNQDNGQASGQKTVENENESMKQTFTIQKVDKEIPYETQVIESDSLLPGMSKVQQEGEPGLVTEVVKTFEVGGQPVDQQIQRSIEIKRPKKKVIIQNSQPAGGKPFDIKNLNISKTLTVEATAYTYTGCKTATGITPYQGVIAVDPRIIAMGSKVYVEGYGYAVAADTGGDIKGNRVDLFFPNLRQCINWGRKPVKLHILSVK